MNILLNVYYNLFHTHLIYGILLWDNSGGAQDVFKLQKQALRILKSYHALKHHKPIFKSFNIFTVSSLIVLASVLFVHEINFNFFPLTDVYKHNTRGRHNLLVPKYKLQKVSYNYNILSIKFYNKFLLEIRNLGILK